MTEQEAMEIIMQVAYDGEFPLNSNEAFGIACKALEKQIPIKPIGSTNICPKCQDVEFGFNEPKYCPNCGQAIKWEDNA